MATPKLPMGYWRQRANHRGHLWGLGPQVLRLFDCEVNAGVEPYIAYQFAIDAWEVRKAPPSPRSLVQLLKKR